jgi:hypothetical protein
MSTYSINSTFIHAKTPRILRSDIQEPRLYDPPIQKEDTVTSTGAKLETASGSHKSSLIYKQVASSEVRLLKDAQVPERLKRQVRTT